MCVCVCVCVRVFVCASGLLGAGLPVAQRVPFISVPYVGSTHLDRKSVLYEHIIDGFSISVYNSGHIIDLSSFQPLVRGLAELRAGCTSGSVNYT